MKKLYGSLLLLTISSSTMAADVIQLEGISILGSTENSNIMTITSWQTPPEIEIPFEPIEGGYQEEQVSPIHPKRFHLEVDYARRFQAGIGNLTNERKGMQ